MAARCNKVGTAAEDNATGLSKVAELLPVLARYNALPLTSGDAETLDAHLTSLIRYLLYLIRKKVQVLLACSLLGVSCIRCLKRCRFQFAIWPAVDFAGHAFPECRGIAIFHQQVLSLLQSACFWWM